MKLILTIVSVLALAVGGAFGDNGPKTEQGRLKAVDLPRKKITVEVAGKGDVIHTLTPESRGVAEIDKLVGRNVTVVSSQGKVVSVAPN